MSCSALNNNNKVFNNRDSYNASLFSNCLPGYDKVLVIKQNPKDNTISIISKCVRTTDAFVNDFLKKTNDQYNNK